MRVLGISAFQRDSAAALVIDGRPVAAAQEERFSRKRQDEGFPKRSVRYCLDSAGVRASDLDAVVFYEKPLRKFERLLATLLRSFPRSASPFSKIMFLWLGDRLWTKIRIADELGVPTRRIAFVEHQRSLAANAFLTSPFEESAVLSVDDAGEWATTGLFRGEGSRLESVGEIHFPHSLGLFASAMTQFLGFEPGSDEPLVEMLASLGTPRFAAEMQQLVRAEGEGAFSIDQARFRFAFDAEELFDGALEEILGPRRYPTAPLKIASPDTRDADLSASVQQVLEERVLGLAEELHRRTSSPRLCFGGQLARNRRLNARLLADSPFEELFVAPCPSDAGAAVGAALDYSFHANGTAPGPGPKRARGIARLGESVDERAEEGALPLAGPGAALGELSRRLVAGQRVGWVRGPMELGPLSMGNRSLLADARGADARTGLLQAVQRGEPFVGCRVALPRERAADYLAAPGGAEDLMRWGHLRVPATELLLRQAPSAASPDGLVWPQLVDGDDDPDFHGLLHSVGRETGAPLLLHATFRLRGAPMVRNEVEAVDAFRRSGLDALVVADRLYARD